ncbi:hypothetical protein BDP27DRAFT_1418991 [Rhodocollybia butyracea]|uniref:Uncharacterized protein n=1 Tax=Rhodocollybia butyracea TaxID=206335 RepID=A0A9P5U9W5_9AGAR|nr:hypothetical protein BDP27DRAFT_1418991 [Rhodocollybia butyracea]
MATFFAKFFAPSTICCILYDMLFRKLVLATLLSLSSNLLVVNASPLPANDMEPRAIWKKIKGKVSLEKKFIYSLSVWKSEKSPDDEAWSLIFTPPDPQADLLRFFAEPVAKEPLTLKSASQSIERNLAVPPDVEIIDLEATARYRSEKQGPDLLKFTIKEPTSKKEGTSLYMVEAVLKKLIKGHNLYRPKNPHEKPIELVSLPPVWVEKSSPYRLGAKGVPASHSPVRGPSIGSPGIPGGPHHFAPQ